MCIGETNEYKMKPSIAYGKQGNEALKIPPDTELLYTITLKSVEHPPDLFDMSTSVHFSEAERYKQIGNDAFKSGYYISAFKRYDQALKTIKHDQAFEDDEKERAKPVIATINSNIALVHFKKEEYTDCLAKINEVLNFEPDNAKALVRRGQAHMMLGNHEEAKADLKRALELEPNHEDIKKVLAANKKKHQRVKEKEQQMSGGFTRESVGRKMQSEEPPNKRQRLNEMEWKANTYNNNEKQEKDKENNKEEQEQEESDETENGNENENTKTNKKKN